MEISRPVLEYAGDLPSRSAAPKAGQVAAPDAVVLFANGDISRTQAMRRLGIGYGELLDQLVARGLALPRVDDVEAERMSGMLIELMDGATR
jgi:hypothetical protein